MGEIYNDKIHDKGNIWFGNYILKELYNKGII